MKGISYSISEKFQNKSNEISKFSSVIHKKQTQAEFVSLFIVSIDLYCILTLYTKIIMMLFLISLVM